MTPERYREVGRLYREAVELEPVGRAAFLDGACAGDAELRREVESLLEHDARAGDFIAAPAFEVVARAMAAEPAGVGSGRTIGHYRIVSHLGGGGMGEVYLAEDPQLGRRVALKLLPALFAYDPDRMRRFRVEARAANLLDHPNIAAIYSVEEAGGNHFITMEYVEGRPLSDLIPEGGLAVATFFEWLVPLAGALAHAHERGVIHRDLKPANVVVTPDGVPKMLDFGLARLSGAAKGPAGDLLSQTLTAAGTVIGTPAYMSPEQARGDRVDPRSDLFSFGVLMYEALTGRRPFRGESSAAVITQLLDVEPPDVAELRPDAPPLLVRLVGRCLQKDVRHRQQTAAELRATLEAARDSRA